MRAIRAVLEYLAKGNVEYIFGIPAGSVNALFDELNELPQITPVVTKHEGAAGYMAASYAKIRNTLAVCVGSSGPGSTNLLTGAANAAREHSPVLFLTGHVPVPTEGRNASQEFDAEPVYRSVVKYSVTVRDPKNLLSEVVKAVTIALSDVPGPVHVAMPIDVQLGEISNLELPDFPIIRYPSLDLPALHSAALEIVQQQSGCIFVGQGCRGAVNEVLEMAELLNWPIVATPQAKGLIPESHPLFYGIYGFAAHERATKLITEGDHKVLLVAGSSLGETATSNYTQSLVGTRFLIHMDIDQQVFNRVYKSDIAVCGSCKDSLSALIDELKTLGVSNSLTYSPQAIDPTPLDDNFNTQNVLLSLQTLLPQNTRYTSDIGEHMSYVIHHMRVFQENSFAINVHFGPMGNGIGSAIGGALAEPHYPYVCITGDGCFFMHGMEVLTAKEYHVPILFVILNNSRLGMVYHGHNMQYGRTHGCFEQDSTNIANMAAAMNIASARIESLNDLTPELIAELTHADGPAILEVALIDNNTPPMGDRVKFLSSFGS
ncbi:thiamine pyrophosphate-binding protein [Alicyclobacillus tolerans]|uniref:thiamine pyrophosphate-binding protein n=1 Tax=Alicyclobacillus tolerans TaxID=90970 RepID=UPI001F3EEA69|nr:thiamine pyrophosphate-binding protein [Alicyclobacillus tolerans]MCF8567852.1 thiamine pyrophosphate-binding protein [Alicyclobacillus tolerans]